MKPSLQDVQNLVVRAKHEALQGGIAAEHLDAVASALATLELLGIRSDREDNGTSAPMLFPQTFGEWAQQFDLKTHFDRFIAITMYLHEQKQTQAINTNDIAQMYNKARWQKPKNMADVFAKGAERMYFAEADDVVTSDDGLKMWRLTRTGYNHLQGLRMEETIHER